MNFHLEWARAHPYTASSFVAGALLIIGALIVGERSSHPQVNGMKAWGATDSAFINPISFSAGNPSTPETTNQLNTQPAPDFTALPIAQNTGTEGQTASEFDLNDLLNQLIKPAQPANTTDNTPDLRGAYAFIPQGLISTTTPGPKRTPLQQELYLYGNDVGSYITTYESSHRNAGQILTDQVQDRQNQQKSQAVKDIGAALASVGNNLRGMDDVPSIVATVHAALAKSYIDMGTKLALVPDAESDQAYIGAIEAYNAAADGFAKQYVALANIFVGTGIVFAPDDPGAVFSFTANSGL